MNGPTSECAIAKKQVPVERSLLAGIGFSCRPFSGLNPNRKVESEAFAAGRFSEAGKSAQTYVGAIGFIEAHRPKIIILENVVGVLTKTASGRPIDRIRQDLNALGYRFDCKILDSCDFHLPQKRRRVFMWAVLEPASETFSSVASLIDSFKSRDVPAIDPFVGPVGGIAPGRGVTGASHASDASEQKKRKRRKRHSPHLKPRWHSVHQEYKSKFKIPADVADGQAGLFGTLIFVFVVLPKYARTCFPLKRRTYLELGRRAVRWEI